jgi:outer membrane protein TolC
MMQRLLLFLILMPTFLSAQNRATLPADLTLKQALEIAFLNNSVLREARANLEKASGTYEQSRSVLLPQINVFAHQGYLTLNLPGFGILIPGQPNLIGPFSSMDARAIFTQDLLNIGGIRSWKSFSSRREAASFLVENAREVVTLNVVGAYLQALSAKGIRDALTEQTKLATDLYQLTASRTSQGVASELDANRAKQQVNTRTQELQEAEQSYVASKLNLANILQATITSDFEVADQAAYGSGETMDKGASVQAAYASRPDYRAAAAAVRAAELEVKSIEATRLPVLRLRVSDGQSGNTPEHNVNTYNVQGTLEVPIFTSGRIRGEIHEAEGTLQEATAALDKNRAQIESEVLMAISGVEWALKEVETSTQNVGLSRQEVELSRSRFSQGVTDNTEVVNAQDRLSRADDARIRALYTLGLARANLARAIGGAERAYRK